MVTPTSPDPLDLAPPVFPVGAAEELDRVLGYVATKLEQAKTARTLAERDLTEFEGGVAEQYREDLRRHVGHLDDTIEQIRRTIGLLRDAIEDHEAAVRRHQRGA
jgi:chromosome segregation ATPase